MRLTERFSIPALEARETDRFVLGKEVKKFASNRSTKRWPTYELCRWRNGDDQM